MTVVETSVWIDVLHGTRTRQAEWVGRNLRNIALTELILTEALQGIREDELYISARDRLLNFRVFEGSGIDIGLASAQNYRFLRKKGVAIRSTIDCLTATFCIVEGHSLLHNDRDFYPFEKHLGLSVVRV